MKQVMFFALSAAIALTSFAAPTLPIQPVKNPSEVIHFSYNESRDLTGEITQLGCSEELITLQGSIHESIYGTYNTNTGEVNFYSHSNTQGVTATDAAGNVYRFIGVSNSKSSITEGDCTMTYSYVETQRIVSRGNFYNVKQIVSYTYNHCTGEQTFKREKFTGGCE